MWGIHRLTMALALLAVAGVPTASVPASPMAERGPAVVVAWTLSAGGYVASPERPPSGATLGQSGPIGCGSNASNLSSAGFWPLIVGRSVTGIQEPPALQDRLWQNRPNPFNPTTTIHYSLARESGVAIHVYTVRGEKVRTLFGGEMAAGIHEVEWDGRSDAGAVLPSGVYFLALEIEDRSLTRKMLFLK